MDERTVHKLQRLSMFTQEWSILRTSGRIVFISVRMMTRPAGKRKMGNQPMPMLE